VTAAWGAAFTRRPRARAASGFPHPKRPDRGFHQPLRATNAAAEADAGAASPGSDWRVPAPGEQAATAGSSSAQLPPPQPQSRARPARSPAPGPSSPPRRAPGRLLPHAARGPAAVPPPVSARRRLSLPARGSAWRDAPQGVSLRRAETKRGSRADGPGAAAAASALTCRQPPCPAGRTEPGRQGQAGLGGRTLLALTATASAEGEKNTPTGRAGGFFSKRRATADDWWKGGHVNPRRSQWGGRRLFDFKRRHRPWRGHSPPEGGSSRPRSSLSFGLLPERLRSSLSLSAPPSALGSSAPPWAPPLLPQPSALPWAPPPPQPSAPPSEQQVSWAGYLSPSVRRGRHSGAQPGARRAAL